MKKLLLVLALCATPALAQITVVPGDTAAPSVSGTVPQQVKTVQQLGWDMTSGHPMPVKITVVKAVPTQPAPTPSATPAPKKRHGFFGFLRHLYWWGEKDEKPAPVVPVAPAARTVPAKPTPAPKPTPTPKLTPKPEMPPQAPLASTPKPTPQVSPTPSPLPKPTPKPQDTPKATPAPKATPTPKATPSPVSTPAPSVPPAMVSETTAQPINNARYLQIKEQALKEPQVAALLQKMQAEPEKSEAYKSAAHAYLSALFTAMRKLDPSMQEALNRKEGAYQRRIENGKPIVE